MLCRRAFIKLEKYKWVLSDLRLFFSLPIVVHLGILAFLSNLYRK